MVKQGAAKQAETRRDPPAKGGVVKQTSKKSGASGAAGSAGGNSQSAAKRPAGGQAAAVKKGKSKAKPFDAAAAAAAAGVIGFMALPPAAAPFKPLGEAGPPEENVFHGGLNNDDEGEGEEEDEEAGLATPRDPASGSGRGGGRRRSSTRGRGRAARLEREANARATRANSTRGSAGDGASARGDGGAALGLPSDDRLRQLLSEYEDSHQSERAALMAGYAAQFPTWRSYLWCGFSVAVRGFGSKKALLERFGKEALAGHRTAVVAINGYAAKCSVLKVLLTCAKALSRADDPLDAPMARRLGAPVMLKRIWDHVNDDSGRRLCIVVHNIDGPGMRTAEAQAALARLAAHERIHLVASVDHVNAALMWDGSLQAQFNWLWVEAPTFESYAVETLELPLPLSTRSEQRALQGAMAVLKHVTNNAREAFSLLAAKQLEQIAEGAEHRKGLTMEVYYTSCREKWIVSGLDQLKTFCTEFKDHALISSHHVGGQDLTYIPLSVEEIKALMAQLAALTAEEAAAAGKGTPGAGK